LAWLLTRKRPAGFLFYIFSHLFAGAGDMHPRHAAEFNVVLWDLPERKAGYKDNRFEICKVIASGADNRAG
jgi:hypothetical protein